MRDRKRNRLLPQLAMMVASGLMAVCYIICDFVVRPAAAVSTFCPECGEEQFVVTVKGTGSGPDEWGTCHWFYGDGVCSECGYKGEYSDSSH